MFLQLVMFALVASSWARSTPSSQNLVQEETSHDLRGGLNYLFKVYGECASTDMATCLKMKLISLMDRADRAFPEVPLVNGFVSLVKSDNASSSSVVYKSENEIEAALPRSFGDKNVVLNSIIAQKFSDFLNSHTIKIKMPSLVEMQRSLIEGRKKKDKEHTHMSLYYTILLGILLPLAIGTLAIFAGKAVLASTIALVLSSIIGLKNLFQPSNPNGYNRNHYGFDHNHGERHDYHRYHSDHDAYNNDYSRHYSERDESQGTIQDLAYNAYQSKP